MKFIPWSKEKEMTDKTIKVWKKNSSGDIQILSSVREDDSWIENEAGSFSEREFLSSCTFGEDYGYIVVGELPYVRTEIKESITWIIDEVVNKYDPDSGEVSREVQTICFTKKNGELRVITGYWTGSDDSFGRLYFIDMEQDEEENLRLVDKQKIKWVISNGTKYTVK